MIPGAFILTNPQSLSDGGYLAVPENDAQVDDNPEVRVVRVRHLGHVPSWYALLTNAAYGADRPPRFLGGSFLGQGMPNVLALASELGADVYKEKVGRGKNATVAHVPRDHKGVARTLGRFFIMLWNRMKALGIPLERNTTVYDSIDNAIAARLMPREWRLSHAELPEALKIGGQVESWIRRDLPYRSGQRHRVLRRSPFWLADKLIEVPVACPPWTISNNLETEHVLYQGGIASVPKEWSDWWMPGGNSTGRSKRHAERVLWSCAEWGFAQDIGCSVVPTRGFDAREAMTYADAFPKAAETFGKLSRRSWIDGWIALKLARLGELPVDKAGTISPYALWTRGLSMIWQMRWARMIQEAAQEASLPMQVAGFGANKVHVQHSMSETEWVDFQNLVFKYGCYALPHVPGISADSLDEL